MPSAVKANHWTTREFPLLSLDSMIHDDNQSLEPTPTSLALLCFLPSFLLCSWHNIKYRLSTD